MKKRILSGVLALSLILTFVPVKVNASNLPAIAGSAGSVTASGVSVYSGSMLPIGAIISAAGTVLPGLAEDYRNSVLDAALNIARPGEYKSYDALCKACNAINELYVNPGKFEKYISQIIDITYEDAVSFTAFIKSAGYAPFKVTEIEVGTGTAREIQWVITDEHETIILANRIGQYPYAIASHDKFVFEDNIRNAVAPLNEMELDMKYRFLVDNATGIDFKYMEYTHLGSLYKIIGYYDSSGGLNIYCNEDGYMYGARIYSGVTPPYAAENERDPVEVETPSGEDVPITDGQDMQIDIDDSLYFMPDGTISLIEDLIYNPADKSYTITATNSFNTTNNTYLEYNTFNVYYIEYTSVTYIGSTGEYTEEYKYYYELPDGRSSADLTADELEALNTYIDVLPYIRSADDTSIRALYHFDGDTLDSSYWSHIGNFGWDKGASITYMEANAFNGCLYLDETDHKFHIQLPSNIGSKDFTLQFRYYQSYTATPQLDSYVAFEDTKLIQFNGASLLDGSGTALNAISVGNWQEICLQRIDGTLSIFLNGVPVGTSSLPGVLLDSASFVFGSAQQTYKYFDELRIVDKAVYPATGYTPSSVPFDTNLALVLPDSSIPVADEYWSFTSSKVNLLSQYGLDDWWGQAAIESSYLKSSAPTFTTGSYSAEGSNTVKFTRGLVAPASYLFPYFYRYSNITSFTAVDGVGFTTATAGVVDNYTYETLGSGYGTDYLAAVPTGGLFTCLAYDPASGSDQFPLGSGWYTFSMVDADGQITSISFEIPSALTNTRDWLQVAKATSPSGYTLAVYRMGAYRYVSGSSYFRGNYFLTITAPFGQENGEFIYWELVEGNSTDLQAEFVRDVVVMDKADINTPTLAIRTDIDITGYQIGGVRPSLPEKGHVWALVESSRITSLQIYNGQAWVEVDGRIWTGERWIPYYAYDVLLLKDLYDVVGANPEKDYIYTESGFWTWLQTAWGQMMAKLEQIRVAITDGTGGGSGGDSSALPDVPPDDDGNDGWSFVDLVVTITDGTWTILTGTVKVVFNGLSGMAGAVVDIGDYFSVLDPENTEGIFFIPLTE